MFSQAIGISASWDLSHIEEIYGSIAKEANYRGTRLFLAPVVDLASEPRWRRIGETVGEDSYQTGKMLVDEMVQLYIHDKVASVTRPVKELKDFTQITLKPGETKTVSFTINESKFKFWNVDMKFVSEPSDFELQLGASSDDIKMTKTITVVEK